MVLDKLGKSLREALRKIARAGYIDAATLDVLLKEIQRALLSSDVKVDLVFKLTEAIKSRSSNEKPPEGLSPREHILHIVYEELTKLLGGKDAAISENARKIMLVGLFGSGKTTTCAKLAKVLQKKGLKVCLIGTDTWRPAAFEQLRQLAAEINAPFFGDEKLKDPVKILKDALPKTAGFDAVIVDSAGRNSLDKELSAELKAISDLLKPDETLLVLSADIGQKASEQANGFNSIVPVTGVVLTKMDSSAKGGGALSACAALGVPIKFVGLGEKIDAFESFNGTKFVSKLLGMGDMESLLKKTEEIFAGTSKDQVEAITKGQFNLKDFRAQIESMRKIGPLKKIFEMLPMGSLGMEIPEAQFQLSEEKINKFTHMMDSMTPAELDDPDMINASRIQRISRGCGMQPEDVKGLLNHFNMTKKMIKRFGKMGRNKKALEQMSKKFKGFPGFKGPGGI